MKKLIIVVTKFIRKNFFAKIKYDKKAFLIISTVFLLSAVINSIVLNKRFDMAIAVTLGVFMPYLLFSIIYQLYSIIKYREFRLFNDWRYVFFLLFFQVLFMVQVAEQQKISDDLIKSQKEQKEFLEEFFKREKP